MSGFNYTCDTCDWCTSVDDARSEGQTCLACGVGTLRLLAAVDDDQRKTFAPPGSGEKEGGRGPLDPTGPLSEIGKDETLRADISENNSADLNSYAQAPRGLERGRHEVGAEDDLGDDDELAISAYVRARRYTKAMRKLVRGWRRMGHAVASVQCSVCRVTCVIAGSTQGVIDEAWDRGLRYEVICDECADGAGCEEGGIVAVQAEELRKVQGKMLGDGMKGRVN